METELNLDPDSNPEPSLKLITDSDPDPKLKISLDPSGSTTLTATVPTDWQWKEAIIKSLSLVVEGVSNVQPMAVISCFTRRLPVDSSQ